MLLCNQLALNGPSGITSTAYMYKLNFSNFQLELYGGTLAFWLSGS